jgi:hypothetical protein
MDSNASRARKVERKVWQDNDFLRPGQLLKLSPLGDGQSAVSTLRKWGQGACCYWQLRCLQSARAFALRSSFSKFASHRTGAVPGLASAA